MGRTTGEGIAMASTLTQPEEAQLAQTVEMFEVITQSQPSDYQSLEILKEAYVKLGREADAVNTSKRIAQAYVQMGQLSSAILEYETILQRQPGDPEIQSALAAIESKTTSYPSDSTILENAAKPQVSAATMQVRKNGQATPQFEDGRKAMHKIFVESKLISAVDFEQCWPGPAAPHEVPEPFIQRLADKEILPVEQSLKLLSDRSRMAFLPLAAYDIDMDLARQFPKDICRRWCVLPFDRMSKSVFVATANPFNQQAAHELAQATPSRLQFYLVPPADLVKVIRRAMR